VIAWHLALAEVASALLPLASPARWSNSNHLLIHRYRAIVAACLWIWEKEEIGEGYVEKMLEVLRGFL